MKQLLYILLVFVLFACKKGITDSKAILNTKKDTIEQKLDKNISLPKEKSNVIKKDTINLKKQKADYPIDLFNTKLIGLAIKDSVANNPYNKYWIDFDAYCYSPAISFYIDTYKKKIYGIEYTFENTPIEEDKILFQFDIKRIISDNGNYDIYLNKVEQFTVESYDKIEYIETVFNFEKLNTVYELTIKNNPPIFYSEVNRYNFFVNKKKESKFEHEDCGDFDG
ncbi:hypothetical protein [Aquimarina algiphila]|uniref:hypothetical protein n=1 Tax=Aquimarina algiphila TaxID=2047982 RepID=UPI00232EC1D6|nr:hypothetical protein [Aquimarina algiphila]